MNHARVAQLVEPDFISRMMGVRRPPLAPLLVLVVSLSCPLLTPEELADKTGVNLSRYDDLTRAEVEGYGDGFTDTSAFRLQARLLWEHIKWAYPDIKEQQLEVTVTVAAGLAYTKALKHLDDLQVTLLKPQTTERKHHLGRDIVSINLFMIDIQQQVTLGYCGRILEDRDFIWP